MKYIAGLILILWTSSVIASGLIISGVGGLATVGLVATGAGYSIGENVLLCGDGEYSAPNCTGMASGGVVYVDEIDGGGISAYHVITAGSGYRVGSTYYHNGVNGGGYASFTVLTVN